MEVKINVTTKTKVFTIIIASIVVCLLIYSPLTHATQSNENFRDEITISDIEQCELEAFRESERVRFVLWFLKHAEPTEVDGTVIALVEKKVILNTNKDQIRINLPPEWTVDDEVLTRGELFASNYLSEGESVTIKALKADLIDREGLCIYLLIGYEIINQEGVHSIANLHVNIEA
jgi:hypothetical protein